MQKKAQPDTPVQRRSSARLLELPPASKGLTGEEKERHGEPNQSSPKPPLQHWQSCTSCRGLWCSTMTASSCLCPQAPPASAWQEVLSLKAETAAISDLKSVHLQPCQCPQCLSSQ